MDYHCLHISFGKAYELFGNLLGQRPALAPVTWVVQVMPLFFLAGGAAGAYGWRAGTQWGTWLFARAQRLCRPVFWYLAFWTVGLFVTGLPA